MRKSGIHITRHACLYEIASVYVTNQPNFLNSSVRAVTQLGPHELLRALKKIEKDMCRTDGIRYGPRPIDLDILFHVKRRISSEILTVPHERIWERPFVMAPLMDLLGSTIDSDIVSCWHSFSLHSRGLFDSWEKLGDEPLVGKEGLKMILPIGNGFWDRSMKTAVIACQMVMFSATWPPSVHQLAQEFMDPNPVKVVVGSEDLAANHDVMQIVEVLDEHSRDGRLVALLEKYLKSKEP